ncbi:hypothetical protein JK361_11815 [Streptomyces sp. 5-8]|uniref:Secreted protein n=1 Tax=Streptomyces musisoli TaxID=2802280 RepID=A0ABS1P007_9ACTN|nr:MULTISPECIES: hypothetical protein [Streptomyces]MBL1105266.1 hypothetical protein [Streptomyces musisoli]MBY8843807.1 hypothetical protein [Streptomyces sp. SP2-10]
MHSTRMRTAAGLLGAVAIFSLAASAQALAAPVQTFAASAQALAPPVHAFAPPVHAFAPPVQAFAVPVHAFAGTDRAPDRKPAFCGTDKASGLAVWAAEKKSCATAVRVAAAYTKVWRGSAGTSVEVRAAGAAWKCRERQGDPNPYQECVDTSDSSRWVRLSS